MNITISQKEKEKIILFLQKRVEAYPAFEVKYLDLGVSVIRVLCHTGDILPVLYRQLGYVLRDDADHYDSTIIVWKDADGENLLREIFKQLSPQKQTRIRIELLVSRGRYTACFNITGEDSEQITNCMDFDEQAIEIFDELNKTAYVSYPDFEPEAFVKQGHAFVRVINHLIKSDTVNLTHGAVFGYNGNGFLLCGRGKRGKSTLTVESMLQGFEYVSDDYQILKKTQGELFSYPIYSIVTLSYRMYNEMYDRFLGKFVCNNFAQDKYLFNIAPYHGQFRTEYPIRFCLFPEIVENEHPHVCACTPQEKGRAVVQMIHSTLMQMGELGDKVTVQKLMQMVWKMPYVKLNLCSYISENTACLRAFLESGFDMHPDGSEPPQLLLDVTFDLATILDTQTLRFTEMNRFATDIFRMLASGADPELIREQLEGFVGHNSEIMMELEKLMSLIEERKYAKLYLGQPRDLRIDVDAAGECDYKMSVVEYVDNNVIDLLK